MTEPRTPRRPAYRNGNARTSYMSVPGDPPGADDPLLAFPPAPHSKPRRNTITAAKQRRFIAALAASGIVTQAAKEIGASTSALYKLRHLPGAEAFSAAWDDALDRGVQRLEDCALTRAIQGEERMVVSAGKVLGTEVRHNDALVMFFLRHRRADRYATEVRAGHPLYERIRAEVLADLAADMPSGDELLEQLNARFDAMRANEEALARIENGDWDEIEDEIEDGDAAPDSGANSGAD